MAGKPEIGWENTIPGAERAAIAAALWLNGLVATTLTRLYGHEVVSPAPARFTVRHLATGGAKRVYLVTTYSHQGGPYLFILKQFLPIQLAYLPPGATIAGAPSHTSGLDGQLLVRMVWAAERVDELAPGLCPRFGGFWEWMGADSRPHRSMTEAYVQGHSLDGWKAILEDRFIREEIAFAEYTTQRRVLERQAIAAYIRLWVVLGRQTFTSDPSPWNVIFVPTPTGHSPSIIDLHSIHDGGTPLYVFQILEELFGNRDEIRVHALCPGILDALGESEGVQFLRTVRAELETQAEVRLRTGLSSYAASIQGVTRFLSQNS